MFFWRISNYADLSGVGAERSSGRWHSASAGKRLVYLAKHPALALLENIANLAAEPRFFPDHFQLLKFSASNLVRPRELTGLEISQADLQNPATTKAIGDNWLTARSSALLRVPAVPAPESWNYLLNPLHPDAVSMKLEWAKRITYDRRLFHLSK